MKSLCKNLLFLIATVAFFASSSNAEWNSLGNVSSSRVIRGQSVLVMLSSGARVKISCAQEGTWLFIIAPNGKFEKFPDYATSETIKNEAYTVALSRKKAISQVRSNKCGRVEFTASPFSLKIFDTRGETVLADDVHGAYEFNDETNEIRTTKLRGSELETYYGFGEKAFSELSRDGKFISNWNTDTFAYPIGTDPLYQSIPFFYALNKGKSYGVFFNNTFRTWFDMGASNPKKYSFGASGGELNYYVFTGGETRNPKRIIEDYSHVTGRMPLPPRWALGFQQSRWSYFPESRVREIAEGFKNNRIPLDAIYFDIDYMAGYRVFTWDNQRFPNPSKLVADLRAQGIHTVLMIDPGIKKDPNYDVYNDGIRADVFVRTKNGETLIRRAWAGDSAFPDFTNPKAREWFGEQYQEPLKQGVAGFWNDMNEPGVFLDDDDNPKIMNHPRKTFPLDAQHFGEGKGGDHRRYHNVYGLEMTRASFEGLRKLEPKKRPFVLTRAGFAGVQRYSAVWTGDNVASWDHLALSIPMLLNLSVSGVPFVGADAGGFQDMPTAELYARWLQAAALTPFFRAHSVGWVGDKEPWAFGEEFTKINRETIELRYRFLPYLYTQFYLHEKDGTPVMRPLWFDYPEDTGSYLINDEFLLGSDILVAPVMKPGDQARGIYLPKGTVWYDFWTGETIESGKMHYLKFPLDRLPIYVRKGAVIPMQDAVKNTGEMKLETLKLLVVGGDAEGSYFTDSGDGYGYKNGESCWMTFRSEAGTLTAEGSKGAFCPKILEVKLLGK
ncbi:MAG: TIM-barrel domain-containing protein [Pyrinomonadaceae bacterium]